MIFLVELIHATKVDPKDNVYHMEFWADNISECVPPSGMEMSGGSMAVITSNSSVKNYIYDSSSQEWKEDLYGIVSAEIRMR